MKKQASTPAKPTFPGDTPTGKVRRFRVKIEKYATIALDESVIAQGLADDGYIFKNPDEEQVLQHLTHCLVGLECELSDIDGYANCPNLSATVSELDSEIVDIVEVDANDKRVKVIT